MFGVLFRVLFCLIAGTAMAEPLPRWAQPEYEWRGVFTAPRDGGEFVMVNLSLTQDFSCIRSMTCYDADGSNLPFRVVWQAGNQAEVLVGLGDGGRPGKACALYLSERGIEGGGRGSASLRDPEPITIEVKNCEGKSPPNSWEKMNYLYALRRQPTDVLFAAGFGELDLVKLGQDRLDRDMAREQKRVPKEQFGPRKENWQRRREDFKRRIQNQNWLVRAETLLLCSSRGFYRFAARSGEVTFVLLDDEVTVGWSDFHDEGGWHMGAPVLLEPGLRNLKVYAAASSNLFLDVGWVTPATGEPEGSNRVDGAALEDAIVALPADRMFSVRSRVPVRLESRDRTLHPDFDYTISGAYRFRDQKPVFVRVDFSQKAANWLTPRMTFRWRFDEEGQPAGAPLATNLAILEGPNARWTYRSAGLHRATLTVRDEMGFEQSITKPVDCRLVQPQEHAVHVDIRSLLPVCRPEDLLEPSLLVSGCMMSALPFSVQWRLIPSRADEPSPAVRSESFLLSSDTRKVFLGRARYGDIRSIEWQLQHAGVPLQTGEVLVESSPFQSLPVRVDGDAFFDAQGRQVVLCAPDGTGPVRQGAITTDEAFGSLVCIDDCLATSETVPRAREKTYEEAMAFLVDGPDRPKVTRFDLPPWTAFPSAYGPLLKFVHVQEALKNGADVVVFSLVSRDAAALDSPALFARHIAVLTDLVIGGMGRKAVWMTPPPFPPDPEAMRPYARAIHTVCEARNVPVADLYSVFMGNPDRPLLFRAQDGVLSARGQKLAGETLARTLLGEE
jgi:hypothetical protein